MAWRPQANGSVERLHRFLNAGLAIAAAKNPRRWDEHLQSVLWAYRVTPRAGVEYSPYFLYFGRHPRLPADVIFGSVEDLLKGSEAHGSEIPSRLRAAVEHVKQVRDAANDEFDAKNSFEPKRKFKVGDLVWCYIKERSAPGERSKKFQKKSSGPHRVVAAEPEKGYYTIRIRGKRSRDGRRFQDFEDRVHVERLKLYVPLGRNHPCAQAENRHVAPQPEPGSPREVALSPHRDAQLSQVEPPNAAEVAEESVHRERPVSQANSVPSEEAESQEPMVEAPLSKEKSGRQQRSVSPTVKASRPKSKHKKRRRRSSQPQAILKSRKAGDDQADQNLRKTALREAEKSIISDPVIQELRESSSPLRVSKKHKRKHLIMAQVGQNRRGMSETSYAPLPKDKQQIRSKGKRAHKPPRIFDL